MGVSLPVLGVEGPLGGATVTFSITDDFSSDSGLWLDGTLSPAAITVASNRAIWPPAQEAVTLDEQFSAWTADNPSGWATYESPPNDDISQRSSGQLHGDTPAGTGAANFYTDGTAPSLSQLRRVILTAGAWNYMKASCTAYSTGNILLNEVGAAPNAYFGKLEAVATYEGIDFVRIGTAIAVNALASGSDLTLDYVQHRIITLTDMVRVQPVTEIAWVGATIWYIDYQAKGMVLWKDSSNYIVAYTRRPLGTTDKVCLLAIASGSKALDTEVAVTKLAGGTLQLIPNDTFTSFSVNYGGSEVIAGQALASWSGDVSGRNLTGWYGGMFNSNNTGDINTDAFGSFEAQSVF